MKTGTLVQAKTDGFIGVVIAIGYDDDDFGYAEIQSHHHRNLLL